MFNYVHCYVRIIALFFRTKSIRIMKALVYMKENIYTVGEGYFASFVNYNMK